MLIDAETVNTSSLNPLVAPGLAESSQKKRCSLFEANVNSQSKNRHDNSSPTSAQGVKIDLSRS